MQLRWVLAATILLGLAGLGRPARAGGLQEAGSDCMQYGKAYGYSMQVPDAWSVDPSVCLRLSDGRDNVNSPGNGVTMRVTIEAHSYWGDARARASIRNDLNGWTANGGESSKVGGKRTQTIAPKLLPITIDGRRFMGGYAACTYRGVGWQFGFYVEQMETFYKGYMYKFHAAVTGSGNDATDSANTQAIVTAWNSIRIPAQPLQ